MKLYAATVLITAFDRFEQMNEQLKLLEQQAIPADRFEVVVVDDSGDDRVGERAVERVRPGIAIRCFRTGLPRNVNGVSVARNVGIREARSPLIISIDDDCLPHRDLVGEHIRCHEGRENLIVLGCRSNLRERLSARLPIPVTERKARKERRRSRKGRLSFFDFKTGNISVSWDDYFKSGLFNEDFARKDEHGWEDIEMGYRMLRMRMKMVFNPDALVYQAPTEREKEKLRSAGGAYLRARERFLRMHPEVRAILAGGLPGGVKRFFWLRKEENCFLPG